MTDEPKDFAQTFVMYRLVTQRVAERGLVVEEPDPRYAPIALAFARDQAGAETLYDPNEGYVARPVEICPAEDVQRVAAVASATFLGTLVTLAAGANAGPQRRILDPRGH